MPRRLFFQRQPLIKHHGYFMIERNVLQQCTALNYPSSTPLLLVLKNLLPNHLTLSSCLPLRKQLNLPI
jgi:hypothetical protein